MKKQCVAALLESGFDLSDFDHYDNFFKSDSTMTLAQAGIYKGAGGIREYVKFVSDESPFISSTSMLAQDNEFLAYNDEKGECTFRFLRYEWINPNADMLLPREAPKQFVKVPLMYKVHLDIMDQVYARAVHVFYPPSFLEYFFGDLLNSDGAREFVCSVMIGPCKKSIDLDECQERMRDLSLLSTDGYVDGDSQGCRFLHAVFAKTNPDGHCAHISFEPELDVNNVLKCYKSSGIAPDDFFDGADFESFRTFQLDHGVDPSVGYEITAHEATPVTEPFVNAWLYDVTAPEQFTLFCLGMFMLLWASSSLIHKLLDRFVVKYKHMSLEIQRNVMTYIFELVVTTVALVMLVYGSVDILFKGEETTDLDRVRSLSIVGQLVMVLYTWEMIYRTSMSPMLLIHHVMSTLVLVLLFVAAAETREVVYARLLAILGFHPTTEQTSFIALLLYRFDRFGAAHAAFWVAAIQSLILKTAIFVVCVAYYGISVHRNDFSSSEHNWGTFWTWLFVPLVTVLYAAQIANVWILKLLAQKASEMDQRDMDDEDSPDSMMKRWVDEEEASCSHVSSETEETSQPQSEGEREEEFSLYDGYEEGHQEDLILEEEVSYEYVEEVSYVEEPDSEALTITSDTCATMTEAEIECHS